MSKPFRRALCWIRRDLRLSDHTALAEATALADQVAVVFVFDTTTLDRLEDRDDRRVTFIHDSVAEVDARLRAAGSCLVVLHGDPAIEIPRLSDELTIEAVFAAKDFEPSAIVRDESVRSKLNAELRLVLDHVVHDPEALRNQAGEPFRVFTPYSKAWRANFHAALIEEREADLGRLIPCVELEGQSQPWDLHDLGFTRADLWLPAGEDAARQRLDDFIPKLAAYREERDIPAIEGTSGLSVHLRFGTISIREAFRRCIDREDGQKWATELIWREFYAMILATFPHVVTDTFQPHYRTLAWPGPREAFEAWCEGKTGYPLVDAAMRCLNQTGWMHNRLRMVVASFLTKDLLVDYRLGEAYFARNLLDFELASNNGGWQWAASTGVDAQPYFRIFNPILQSKKFDPDGKFIKQWCPELARFAVDHVHWPVEAPRAAQIDAGCEVGVHYPEPLVDHATQREAAIALLSVPKSGA